MTLQKITCSSIQNQQIIKYRRYLYLKKMEFLASKKLPMSMPLDGVDDALPTDDFGIIISAII